MPNMPKMPKLHKPAFLKKKKTDGEAAPDAEGDAPAEGMGFFKTFHCRFLVPGNIKKKNLTEI